MKAYYLVVFLVLSLILFGCTTEGKSKVIGKESPTHIKERVPEKEEASKPLADSVINKTRSTEEEKKTTQDIPKTPAKANPGGRAKAF